MPLFQSYGFLSLEPMQIEIPLRGALSMENIRANVPSVFTVAISNIKFDKVVVWEGQQQNGTSATANWLHNMTRTLPPMMQVLKDIGGIELPETLAKFDAAAKEPPKPA